MRLRPLASLLVALLAACASAPPPALDPAVADVATAARSFLSSLPPELRSKATRPLEHADRTTWAFVPGRYPGVEFGDLDAAAMQRVDALLRTLLSPRGLGKTMAIVQLENLLRTMESRGGGDASHRDPARYTLLVCGEPSADGAFAVRMQGHHVSMHFTFFGGWLVSSTPHFLGSNPHEQREGPNLGQRVLAAEEDLGRALLLALDATQRATAVVSDQAPPDVLLGPKAAFTVLDATQGLAASAMSEPQRQQLWQLVELFAHDLRPEFGDAELQRLAAQRPELRFVWAGGSERGQGHYWRVQGRTFAIEYDNTQNDANHVHVVWRDRERDFGQDPLRAHLEQHHRAAR